LTELTIQEKGFIREIGEDAEASARQRRTDKHLGAQWARLLDRGANAGEGEAGHDAGEGRNDELNREDDAWERADLVQRDPHE
jgi:hypothetical protein